MSFKNYISRLNLRLRIILPIATLLVISMTFFGGYIVKQQSDGFRRELTSSGETILKIHFL